MEDVKHGLGPGSRDNVSVHVSGGVAEEGTCLPLDIHHPKV